MVGRDFLDAADDLVSARTEAHWRTAVGRAYYALMLESRDVQHRWGLTIPGQSQTHRIVRLRFVIAGDKDLLRVATYLQDLASLRAKADYRPEDTVSFPNAQVAMNCVRQARKGIDLLDLIDADPARRAAAVTAMKKVYP